ncbi:MAG: DUF362 domain-containing protein [Candidatus Cloacimonetes bacterium]|nr:DUF362 domain-containing protein [Candidatus Cloacimonadota bacterium]
MRSKVYFTKDISQEGVLKIFSKIDDNISGKVGIKLHFGEEGNKNFLDPSLIKKLIHKLQASLLETNVLYISKRRYTESHLKLAKEHGFDFAPIDILDSAGDIIIPAKLNHFQEIKVGKNLLNYNSVIVYSHFKGHIMTGFGGAIKNVSMGLASLAGKMALHASAIPKYNPSSCTKCTKCIPECPGNAISINPLFINADKCIGCGKCIVVCPTGSFQVPWGSTKLDIFMKRLVDYAKGISDIQKMVYINVLANISKDCDCDSSAHPPFMENIGILASTDIVAIDKASWDLVNKFNQSEDTFLELNSVSGIEQLIYANEIGLGNIEYDLINK